MSNVTHHEFTFAGGWLDRSDNRRSDSDWIDSLRRAPESCFLPFRGLDVGLRTTPLELAWTKGKALPVTLDATDCIFLGIDENDVGHFAVALDEITNEYFKTVVSEFTDVRSAALQLGGRHSAVIAQARSLFHWHTCHGYCAACGAPSIMQRGGSQRLCTNKSCRIIHFPRTDPVVIMLVESPAGDECLLGRSPGYPQGLVSTLAGFVEPAESIEEAVVRELKEEAGIICERVRYFASQPWPFPSSLMIACFTRATSKALLVNIHELEWARWFSRKEIRLLFDGKIDGMTAPQPIAIAHYMLKHWLESDTRSS